MVFLLKVKTLPEASTSVASKELESAQSNLGLGLAKLSARQTKAPASQVAFATGIAISASATGDTAATFWLLQQPTRQPLVVS